MQIREELRNLIDSNDRNGIKNWIRNAENTPNLEEIEILLPFFALEDIKVAFKSIKFETQISNIIFSWIRQESRTTEDFRGVTDLFSDAYIKMNIACRWLEMRNYQRNLTLDDLKSAFPFISPFVMFEDYKSKIACSWAEGEGRTLEDLKGVLELFGNESTKSTIFLSWIQSSKRNLTLEDIKFIFPLIKDVNYKSNIAYHWVKEEGRTLEEVKGVLDLFSTTLSKSKIAFSFLEGKSEETKHRNFIDFAQSDIFGNRYDTRNIFVASQLIGIQRNITRLCKDLYPNNEGLQCDLITAFLKQAAVADALAVRTSLKNFISALSEDEHALNILRIASIKFIISNSPITPDEIVEISSNRLSNNFESIKELLSKKSLEDSVLEQSFTILRDVFSEESLSKMNLLSLFSYYDIQNKTEIFKSLLKPEVLSEMTESYFPSHNSAYYTQEELNRIKVILGTESKPVLEITGMPFLTGYLQEIIGDQLQEVKQFQLNETYQFGSCSLDLTKIEKMTEEFKSLFITPHPSISDIVNFFEKALNQEPEITDQNRVLGNEINNRKLADFFRANKQFLAYLFSKDEGIDKFVGIIFALGDGCVANIATQANIALYHSLFESINNPCAEVLFQTFLEKVATPIINSGSDRLMGNATGIDILNSLTSQYLLSPRGLVAGIAKNFFENGKNKREAENFIKNELNMAEDAFYELRADIFENHQENYPKFIAEIATYIILKKTLPDILRTRDLHNFCEQMPSAIKQNQSFSTISSTTANATSLNQNETPSTTFASAESENLNVSSVGLNPNR